MVPVTVSRYLYYLAGCDLYIEAAAAGPHYGCSLGVTTPSLASVSALAGLSAAARSNLTQCFRSESEYRDQEAEVRGDQSEDHITITMGDTPR